MDNIYSYERQGDWASKGQCIRSIISISCNMFHAETGGVMLFDNNHDQLVLQKPAFNSNDCFIEKYKIPVTSFSNASRVFNTGEPYLSNNAPSDPFILQEYVRMYNCRNLITVPIKLQQSRLGVLHLLNKQTGNWKQQDLIGLTTLVEDFSPFFSHITDSKNPISESNLVQRLLNIATTKGLHGLTGELASIISDLVVILDHSLKVLSVSPNNLDVSELIQELKKEFDNKPSYAYNEISRFKSNLILPITGDNLLGYIILPNKNNPNNLIFKNKDVANIFALLLQEKNASFRAYVKFKKQAFERLFEREIPKQEALELCNFLEIHLGEPYSVIVFSLTDQKTRFSYCFNIVTNELEGFLGNKDDLLFALIPLTHKDLNFTVNKALKALKNLNPTPVTIGVGEECFFLDDFQISYSQAKKAFELGTKLGQYLNYYSSLQYYDMLYDTEKSINAKSFVQRLLEPIINYDRKHSAELLKTLENYLENDGNLRVTANSLHVHFNTLRYRLSKIEQLSGSSLRNFRVKYQFRLALDILKLQ